MDANLITKSQFVLYEVCRMSGQINMMDTRGVSELTGLNRDQVKCIVMNYMYLRDRYEKELEEVSGG